MFFLVGANDSYISPVAGFGLLSYPLRNKVNADYKTLSSHCLRQRFYVMLPTGLYLNNFK
jgi:hypothetical protein